jgi:hypothetical protein
LYVLSAKPENTFSKFYGSFMGIVENASNIPFDYQNLE